MDQYFGRRNMISMSPADIKFTQDSVGMCFQNGCQLNSTCENIAKGDVQVVSIPTIRVRYMDGSYYSVDNRRLYIFRVLHLLGFLPKITVKEVKQFEREITTENDGCHVRVRSRKDNNNRWQRVVIFRHCTCHYERNKKLPDWWNMQWKCHVDLVNTVRLKHSKQLHSSNIAGRDDVTRRTLTVAPRPYHHLPVPAASTVRASQEEWETDTTSTEDNSFPDHSSFLRKSSRPSHRTYADSVISSQWRHPSVQPQPKQPVVQSRRQQPNIQPVVVARPRPMSYDLPSSRTRHVHVAVNQSHDTRSPQYRPEPAPPAEEESCFSGLMSLFCGFFES